MVLIVAACVAVSGCSGPDQEEVELVLTGACADALFWAATPSGDVAVTVRVDARGRSTTERTTIAVTPGGGAATIEILRGRNLHWNLSNDVIDSRAEPASTHRAVAGVGSVALDPTRPAPVHGSLALDRLMAEDGTRFAPLQIDSDRIGFYPG
jgi:hypothetical protein